MLREFTAGRHKRQLSSGLLLTWVLCDRCVLAFLPTIDNEKVSTV